MKVHNVKFWNLIGPVGPFTEHTMIKKRWLEGRDMSEEEYASWVEVCYEDGNYDDVEYEKTPERQEIRKYYEELQRFKEFKETIKKENIHLDAVIDDENLVPEAVAIAYYNYKAADIFKREDLEQVVIHFKPDFRFNVLFDGFFRGVGDGSDYDTRTVLESGNLRVIYNFSSIFFGSEMDEELKIKHKKTGICNLHKSPYSQTGIDKITKYIDENA